MDRRNFLRTGSLAALGSLAAPSLAVPASVRKALGGADDQSAVAAAMNHFGVTEADLRKVLAAALEKGGDYADLYFEHTFNNSVSLMDGKVNNCGANIDFGMGVRVLAGDQTGYAYVEGVTLDEMLRAARTAARIASSGKAGKTMALTEKTIAKSRYAVAEPWEDVSVKAKIPYLEKLNQKIFSLDKRVSKVQAHLTDNTSHVLFCNSEGVSYYDYRPMVSFVAVCVMEENGKMENGYAGRSYRKGFEFMTDDIVEVLAREAVDKTAILFKAIKPKGGEMPVVMGSGGSGILLHEAIGHAFEADFNRKRTSIFCDLFGKKICDEHINVVDDGTIPFNRGSVNFDDEGVEGQKTYIVKDGVLTSYLHDRI
ncbi:MAG: TldD/PmbA family protein, partial [Bacteroides sp.]|nr:TldD/PmbA family protein [Bacteroides sp.]